jgi:hypothetical protein
VRRRYTALDPKRTGAGRLGLQRKPARWCDHLAATFIASHGDMPSGVRAMKDAAKPLRKQDPLAAMKPRLERNRARRGEAGTMAFNKPLTGRAPSIADSSAGTLGITRGFPASA